MIVFSSDPDFSFLKKIFEQNGLKIDLLVSEAPKRSGRGQQVKKNQAHLLAEESNIEVFTPDRLDDTDSIEKIKSFIKKSDEKMGFVFSYGKIIPQNIIDLFDGKLINLHPSLLPLYRGSTPIQTAILNRDKKTGYSLIKLSNRLDAGDIFYQKSFEISQDDNYDSVFGKIIEDFNKNGTNVLRDILTDRTKTTAQDESHATYTKKINKSDGQIIPNTDTAESALAKVNAFSRWPKAFFILDQKRLIIHEAQIENGKLVLKEVQKEGSKAMPFDQFRRGNGGLLTFLPDFVRI